MEKIDLLSPDLGIIKNIFMQADTHQDFPYIYTGAYCWMGWLILLGRTMQDTTSYFNKTIRCQSIQKKYQWNIFIENVEYEDCMFLRLEVNGKNYDSPIKPGTNS